MTLLEQMAKGRLDKALAGLYQDGAGIAAQRSRYLRLLRANPQTTRWLFSTPGRTELGGNHTDHNNGVVLAGAINLDTIAAVSPSDENAVFLSSEGYESEKVFLDDLSPRPEERGRTAALIRGIAQGFAERGIRVGGFNAWTTSNVLKGSGLSSSAAIEVLIATIFNHLYAADALDPVQLAIIGQKAENVHFGKPCGLMDQAACASGGIVSIDFADPARPKIRKVAFDFAAHGHALVVVDTGGDHADLTADYAAIPSEMRAVARLMGQSVLSKVKVSEFLRRLPSLREEIGNDRALLRALHFLEETKRAQLLYKALRKGDFPAYLALVRESGRSSAELLQNVFCDHDSARQGVGLALALSGFFLKGNGASRVHGGGFAGTIQAYVPLTVLKSYTAFMEKVFGKGSVTVLSIRQKPTLCLAEA